LSNYAQGRPPGRAWSPARGGQPNHALLERGAAIELPVFAADVNAFLKEAD
jgi:hypothetical protein